ncbi:MAG: 50S ribosomal protein L4 [Euryarchaeota archaeon]|nr:50S ribosomal protein L4 [Euryarchaeota archaeon]
MTNVKVYKVDGSVKGEVELPKAFATPVRTDIVRKAVDVARKNARQPYGAKPEAGFRHSVEGWGPGRGVSRVPRLRGGSNAAQIPSAVGGRRAHPPRSWERLDRRMNVKERQLAIRSALAASASQELVSGRGHRFKEGLTLPVIVEDKVSSIAKTSDLSDVLEKIGVFADVERAGDGRHQRAGRGKLRGRRMRQPKSFLLVVPSGSAVRKAAENLPGVDVTTPQGLDALKVAPGGDVGRLIVFSESALKVLEGWK